jgi:DnaK suppressor protein
VPPKKPTKPPAKKAVKPAPAKKPVAKTPVKKATSAAKSFVKRMVDKVTPTKPASATLAKKTAIAAPKAPIKPIPVIKAVQPKIAVIDPKKLSDTTIIVPPRYEPSEKEEFMNPIMREYFRQRLIAWREELLREGEETLHLLHEEGNMQKPDITDRASEETDLAIEFRTRDRERKLINKINSALMLIEDGSYGFCEETGDPIPVKRLVARPTATRTLEAEELHERRERTQRDQFE